MVSGVDSPVTQQNPLIEASTSAGPINQARQGAILNSSQLVVGKQFKAEVVSALTDGTYIVKVADVAARMQLPNSPEVGAKLSLTLIATSPRATFLLNPSDGEPGTPVTTNATVATSAKQLIDDFNQSAAAKTGASGPALQASSAAAPVTSTSADPRLIIVNGGATDSAPATFSSAGKLVNQLIQQTPHDATVVNVSKVPLLATPQVNVNTLARALQSGVSTSGVFYESHVLKWAEGTLPLTELMKEPQASFSTPNSAPNAASNPTPTSAPTQNTAANVATSNPPNNATPAEAAKINLPSTVSPDTRTGIASGPVGNTTATGSSAITLPNAAAPIIQQQLQTMEQQRFMWRGEVWPGQTMEWEISRDRQHKQQQQAEDPEQIWQSVANFSMPQLGNISAQFQLSGTHLKLTVHTQDAATSQILQKHATTLVNALDNTGTQLDSLQIKTKPS